MWWYLYIVNIYKYICIRICMYAYLFICIRIYKFMYDIIWYYIVNFCSIPFHYGIIYFLQQPYHIILFVICHVDIDIKYKHEQFYIWCSPFAVWYIKVFASRQVVRDPGKALKKLTPIEHLMTGGAAGGIDSLIFMGQAWRWIFCLDVMENVKASKTT